MTFRLWWSTGRGLKVSFRPFEALKKEIDVGRLPRGPERPLCEEEPEEFFKKVKPLSGKEVVWRQVKKEAPFFKEDYWPPKNIRVKVELTSEYMEWRAPGVSSEVVSALRSGRFSISGVLDLHGLSCREAEAALEEFFREAVFRGDHCVLIVHGRGLSSPGRPVLKELVRDWLRRGPYRRYVLAYTSARPCDGGPGATYVLLSDRPWKRP